MSSSDTPSSASVSAHDHAGAVLAGHAVHDHRGRGRVGDHPQRRGSAVPAVLGEVQVAVGQPALRARIVGRVLDRLPVDVLEHQVVVVAGRTARRTRPYSSTSNGRRRSITVRMPSCGERRRVGVAEPVQRVRAEEPPPAHRAAVEAGVAADVTEVVGSGEAEVPGVSRRQPRRPNLVSIGGTTLPTRAVSGMLHAVTHSRARLLAPSAPADFSPTRRPPASAGGLFVGSATAILRREAPP